MMAPVICAAMLLLPARWAAAMTVAAITVIVTLGRVTPWYPERMILLQAYAVLSMLLLASAYYGLRRLIDITRQLHTARAELAELAVLRERTRIARDVHDLLGLGLSTITIIIKGGGARSFVEVGRHDRLAGLAGPASRKGTLRDDGSSSGCGRGLGGGCFAPVG